MNDEIIPRTTITQMADSYQLAELEIIEAYSKLEQARERLKLVFDQGGYRFGFTVALHSRNYDNPAQLLREVKKDVWSAIIGRMELKRIMSVAECQKMDKQLETGEGLPDITAPNLIAMLEGTLARVPQLIEQAVKEVYDYLRPSPHGWRFREHKTSQKNQFELTSKHIICGGCEWGYGPHWRTNYHREDMIRAIDNVFHSLDGKGTVKSNRGPLVDAINDLVKPENSGETDYFRFKCFRNGNLHLEIKRQDLLGRFNEIAGGASLKPRNDTCSSTSSSVPSTLCPACT